MTCTPRRRAAWSAPHLAAILLCAVPLLPAPASVGLGRACQNCHAIARDSFHLLGFTSTTNLGAGILKVYEVAAGQTVPLRIEVADGGTEYGLAIVNLDGAGVRDPSHKLDYEADPRWRTRNRYYSLGSFRQEQEWTFNLKVLAATPPDFYPVIVRAAGEGGGRWHDEEQVYVKVIAIPKPPVPSLSDPKYHQGVFQVTVATASGFLYHLEARDPASTAWSVITSVPGDGTTRTLTDPAAIPAHRIYRVRVE